MIRLAVCDDDPIFLSQAGELARCFLDTQKIPASVSCYPDAESLLEARAHCDIYLLDILMPGLDGIALAKELERRDQDFCVIYLTTSEEYALEAFSVDALQYLVKPVTENGSAASSRLHAGWGNGDCSVVSLLRGASGQSALLSSDRRNRTSLFDRINEDF